MKGFEKIAFTGSGYHFGLKDSFIEFEVHLLCERANVADVYSVLMKKILDAQTVNEKDGCVVEHFSKGGDVIFFDSFAGISELKLSFWIGLFTDLAEDHVRERRS